MLYKLPSKILLFDSTMLKIISSDNFGSVIAKVKEILSNQGNLIEIIDVQGKFNKNIIYRKDLPSSIKDYDFILEFSSLLRHRILLVQIQYGGQDSYYIVCKVGDKNKKIKTYLLILLCLLSLLAGFLYGFLFYLLIPLFFCLYLIPTKAYNKKIANIDKLCKSIF